MLFHVLLAAEHDGSGRAGLDAGGLQTYCHPVRAQRALVGLVILLRDARDIEGTAGDAIATADAMVLVEVDDAVGEFDDCPRARAGLQAARVSAVHATILADQPFQVTRRVFMLSEAHQRPGLGAEVMGVVVSPVVVTDLIAQFVPFRTGNLTRLATDAFGGIDQLGHFLLLTHRRRYGGGGRTGNNVLAGHLEFLHVDQK